MLFCLSAILLSALFLLVLVIEDPTRDGTVLYSVAVRAPAGRLREKERERECLCAVRACARACVCVCVRVVRACVCTCVCV